MTWVIILLVVVVIVLLAIRELLRHIYGVLRSLEATFRKDK